jgi:hypothetical protein
MYDIPNLEFIRLNKTTTPPFNYRLFHFPKQLFSPGTSYPLHVVYNDCHLQAAVNPTTCYPNNMRDALETDHAGQFNIEHHHTHVISNQLPHDIALINSAR